MVHVKPQEPAAGIIKIVHEDEDILVLNKPSGLQVHPDKKNKEGTLVNYLVHTYGYLLSVGEDSERPGIVHRLDRDTSGLIIIVKNNHAFHYYKDLFKSRCIKKIYWALVHGRLREKEGIINLPIGITLKRPVTRSTNPYAKNKKEAVTKYKVLKEYVIEKSPQRKWYYTLVEVSPKTGRTHQIRVHLRSIGNPIVGDELYKFKRLKTPASLHRLFLMAKSLEFTDRFGKLLRFEIQLDEELAGVIRHLEI